jgi:hypothetical protein
MKLASVACGAVLLMAFALVQSVKAQTATLWTRVWMPLKSFKASATVEKIDLQSRKVTLLLENEAQNLQSRQERLEPRSSQGGRSSENFLYRGTPIGPGLRGRVWRRIGCGTERSQTRYRHGRNFSAKCPNRCREIPMVRKRPSSSAAKVTNLHQLTESLVLEVAK